MVKVNPDTQHAFATRLESAFMGDYPTLRDIDAAYGKGFSTEWLVPHIDNLARYTGAKNLTEGQQLELARVISAEYQYLKVTELLVFFFRFKAGRYGRFYGSVDPMVVTCALREFVGERNVFIEQFEREKKEESVDKSNVMNYEEWQEIKTIQAMYEMIIPNRK